MIHTRDEQCQVEDGRCIACGVAHGEPCPECRGRAFHRFGCPLLPETIQGLGVVVQVPGRGPAEGTVARIDAGALLVRGIGEDRWLRFDEVEPVEPLDHLVGAPVAFVPWEGLPAVWTPGVVVQNFGILLTVKVLGVGQLRTVERLPRGVLLANEKRSECRACGGSGWLQLPAGLLCGGGQAVRCDACGVLDDEQARALARAVAEVEVLRVP